MNNEEILSDLEDGIVNESIVELNEVAAPGLTGVLNEL